MENVRIPLGRIFKNHESAIDPIEHIKSVLISENYEVTEPRKISGYISRRYAGIVSKYSGIYGNGYKIEIPSYNSTGYHFIIYATMPNQASK